MKSKQLLRNFRIKMLLECLLQALLAGLTVGAVGVFVTSMVYHIRIEETPAVLTAQIGGGLFALVFLTVLILRFPTLKRVARRVDALGLKERAITMVEYEQEQTPIAQMQRADAAAHIRGTHPKRLVMQVGVKHWLVSALSVALAAGMLMLPLNAFAADNATLPEETEPNQAIVELIQQLREEVKSAELEEEMKEQLQEIIDQLEENLENSTSELDQAAQIQEAMKDMQELMEGELTKNQIGEALQMNGLTRPLGEAISASDSEKVTSAMEALKEALQENPGRNQELADAISEALENSGVENTDELFEAMENMSEALENLDPESETFQEEMEEMFQESLQEILEALEEQAAIESEMEEMEDTMTDAKNEVLGIEPEEEEDSEGTEGEEGSEGTEGEEGSEGTEGEEGSEGTEGQEGSEGTEGMEGSEGTENSEGGEGSEGMEGMEGSEGGENMGGGSGGGEGEGSTMTEAIYDPISGNVTYGEVFAAYYAEYLAALEAGEVPEELQEIMDRYFSGLG